jgi:hypothetical protein
MLQDSGEVDVVAAVCDAPPVAALLGFLRHPPEASTP